VDISRLASAKTPNKEELEDILPPNIIKVQPDPYPVKGGGEIASDISSRKYSYLSHTLPMKHDLEVLSYWVCSSPVKSPIFRL